MHALRGLAAGFRERATREVRRIYLLLGSRGIFIEGGTPAGAWESVRRLVLVDRPLGYAEDGLDLIWLEKNRRFFHRFLPRERT